MTRSEAHGKKGDDSLEDGGITQLINDIYDDFESRTCSSCKYRVLRTQNVYQCGNTESIGYDSVCQDTDGCNKWTEKKDEA